MGISKISENFPLASCKMANWDNSYSRNYCNNIKKSLDIDTLPKITSIEKRIHDVQRGGSKMQFCF